MATKQKNIISEEKALAICKKAGLDQSNSRYASLCSIHRTTIDRDLLEKKIQQIIEGIEKNRQEIEEARKEFEIEEREYQRRSLMGKVFFDKGGKLSSFAVLFFIVLACLIFVTELI